MSWTLIAFVAIAGLPTVGGTVGENWASKPKCEAAAKDLGRNLGAKLVSWNCKLSKDVKFEDVGPVPDLAAKPALATAQSVSDLGQAKEAVKAGAGAEPVKAQVKPADLYSEEVTRKLAVSNATNPVPKPACATCTAKGSGEVPVRVEVDVPAKPEPAYNPAKPARPAV